MSCFFVLSCLKVVNVGVCFWSITYHPRCQFDIVCCYCEVSGAAIGSNIAASLRMTDRLTLVVDDTRFVVEPDVFRQYPDTMLGR